MNLHEALEASIGKRCDVCGSKDRRLLRTETSEDGRTAWAVWQCRCRREIREPFELTA